VSGIYYPVSTLPAPFDIVWCRFPEHPDLGEPGPKPRPGLVRNVATDDEGFGEVQLVFGTTTLKMTSRRFDFFVTKQSEMDSCGLYRATRFDLDCVAWIPWASEWFDVLPGYSSPVIGHLTANGIKLLQVSLSLKQGRSLG
jgi:hypothetical protein